MDIENGGDLLRVWHTRRRRVIHRKDRLLCAIAAVRVRASVRPSVRACVHKHCRAQPGPVPTVVHVVVVGGVQCQGQSHVRRAYTTLSPTTTVAAI